MKKFILSGTKTAPFRARISCVLLSIPCTNAPAFRPGETRGVIGIGLAVFLAVAGLFLLCAGSFSSYQAPGASVPRVAYIEPDNDSVINITGKDKITFRWQPVPIPAGSRNSYRFLLNKEPGYNTIYKETLDPRVFSIGVPVEKLEAGCRYSWYVRQRDDRSFNWSQYDIWYFSIEKK